MQLLSSQEINEVSGAFSATNVLDSAANGFLFVAVLGVCFGSGLPALAALLEGAAIFGGITLAYESAACFDEHYGTPKRTVHQL